MPVLVGWTHPYGPLGTPLVDRECREAAVAAWLDHLAADPDAAEAPADAVSAGRGRRRRHSRRRWRSAAAAAREFALPPRARCCGRTGRPRRLSRRTRSRTRSARSCAGSASGWPTAARVTSTAATEPPALTAALADFFALEASGWKGRAGTAAQRNDDVRRFVEQAVTRARRRRQGAASRGLSLDGRAIAADRDAAQRRRRLVLEDRLRRDVRARVAGRAAPARRDRQTCSTTPASRAPIPAPRPAIR